MYFGDQLYGHPEKGAMFLLIPLTWGKVWINHFCAIYLMNTVVPGNLPPKDSAQTAVAFRVQVSEQDDFSTKRMNWENTISRQNESAIVI